jgi:hypothetical protein
MWHYKRRVSEAAFRRWWGTATAARDDSEAGGCQGRRSDLTESKMRNELTEHLAEHNITRPL